MRSDQYAARLAGFMFLFVIATVLVGSILLGGVDGEDDISETLRSIADDTLSARFGVVLLIVASISTFVLAAALYAITKRPDQNLAILALAFRAAEAALYVVGIASVVVLVSLSDGASSANGGELAAVNTVGGVVLDIESLSANLGAIFFAVGSTLFSYLLFMARSIPVPLALLGVVASLILVVGVSIQTAAGQPTAEGASGVIWIPMLLFEISAGVWLLVKGVSVPGEERTTEAMAHA